MYSRWWNLESVWCSMYYLFFRDKYVIAISELRSIRNETGLNSEIAKITSVLQKPNAYTLHMYSLDFTDDIWLLCDFGANNACVYAVFRILNVRMSANYERGIKINLFLMISKNAKFLAWYLATQFPIILYSCVWLNSEWTYAKLR